MKLFIISLFFLHIAISQIPFSIKKITLKADLGMTGRFQGPDVESGYAIKDREPSITDFYTGAPFYEIAVEYHKRSDNKDAMGHFYFGASYMFEILESKANNEHIDLIGNELEIGVLRTFLGYAYYHNPFNKSNYYFLSLGLAFPNYSATGKDDVSKFETSYKNETTYFVSLGSNTAFSKNLDWNYKFTFTPLTTEPLKKKSSDGMTEPIDSNYEFHDTTIRFSLGLSYKF